MNGKFPRHPVVVAVIFAIYFALGKLGLSTGSIAGGATAIWPASGFAIAALVLVGSRAWPAVLAGAFLVLLGATGRVAWSLTIATGATLEAVVGALLVDRLARGVDAFRSPATIFRFIAIAGLGVAPIGAAFGVLATVVPVAVPWGSVVYLWMTWWLASLAGMIVVTPWVLLWVTTPLRGPRVVDALESLTILLTLVGVCLIVFGGRFPSGVQDYPLQFLCVPVLLWAAFRQGRRMVATATVLLAAAVVWGTTHGFGPFTRDSRNEAFILIQAYVSVMAAMALVLAAVVAEHKSAQQRLHELATTDPLTGLVNYRRLLEVLRAEIARTNRTGRPFAVLFLDMDGLKRINDRHGHLAGSRALSRLAGTLRGCCRATDTPARYGGDEFAIVLPETGEEGGLVVLARIKDQLAASPARPSISVTGGVAVCPRDGETSTLLLRAADRVLYRAKQDAGAAGGPGGDRGGHVRKTGTRL